MTDIHVATSGPKVRELVQAVLDEFDTWAKHAPHQAYGLWRNDSEKAAESALQDVRGELMDHLCIPLGIILATWGIEDEV